MGQVLEAGGVELSTDTGILAKIEDGNFAVYRGDDKLWQTDTFGMYDTCLTALVFGIRRGYMYTG